MKLIIDIHEEIYTDVKENYQGNDVLYSAVKYGTPITFLKYRMKDYVFYKVDWLKEHWEKEMELLGVDFSKHDEKVIKETVASMWGKPCADAVSRQDLLQGLCDDVFSYTDDQHEVIDFIEKMPPVYPQNDVLNKIRAEIEEHQNKTEYMDKYDLVGDCLDIINKYRKVEE